MPFLREKSIAVCAAIFLLAACCVSAYEVGDARGKTFRFNAPPKFATIVPSVTQSVYAIGVDNLLMADSRYCDFPEEAKSKPKIGGYIDPDYEKIAELRPPLFILPDVRDSRLPDKLRKFGIPCFFLHGDGLGNISENLRILGRLFRRETAANALADSIDAEIAAVPKSAAAPTSLFMFGDMAAGKGSFAGDIAEAAGTRNAAASAIGAWPVLAREFILTANPDILFVELPSDAEKSKILERYRSDSVWKNVAAVRKSRICFVPRELVTVPSPRVLQALELMRDFVRSLGLK